MGEAKKRREKTFLAKRWLLPQGDGAHYMVYEVLTHDGKRFHVGEGAVRAPGEKLSATGNIVTERLSGFHKDKKIPVSVVGIDYVWDIESQLRTAFLGTPENSSIMLICGSSAVIRGLGGFMEWDRAVTTYPDTAPQAKRT